MSQLAETMARLQRPKVIGVGDLVVGGIGFMWWLKMSAGPMRAI